ncbi:DUF4365 domain-containing protein [Microbulbifer sp. ZKSA002]|uniref:DUF4365 domain-containing protein n=1 Tax=Microbulbifer sp. ZKSA002 TaxID=3243388 RepID=UPI004039F19E
MNAGEIGVEAGRIFTYNLPSNWIYRSQEDQDDFGIDGEIEIKDERGKALGKNSVFKVQIKGEEVSTFINGGAVLSFTIKIERLKYYLNFRIPVILVVVEVSSERIFWLPITNDTKLREDVFSSKNTESMQIHIPVDSRLVRKDKNSFDGLFDAVVDCWDYLSIKGLKESTSRFGDLEPLSLSERIGELGDTLYQAFHQQLDNSLAKYNYDEVYQTAGNLLASAIVPPKDRFVAALYYLQAFNIAPYKSVRYEILQEKQMLCIQLIDLARKSGIRGQRYIAFGKARSIAFRSVLDELHATHFSAFSHEEGSLYRLIFESKIQEMHYDCSVLLKKIIDLCNRLLKEGQYHILADIFIDIYAGILIFNDVHKERGGRESIDFLEGWSNNMSTFVMSYLVAVRDASRIYRLYLLVASQVDVSPDVVKRIRQRVVEYLPHLDGKLDQAEQIVFEHKENIKINNFYDLSVEEQKSYFYRQAKSLRLDPDDSECEFGRVVARALVNYDPTEIMRDCSNLFVCYRPGGIIAETLQMHSAGGFHFMVCLKHGHKMATGGLLKDLYDNPDTQGFRERFCGNCSDCEPRDTSWSWSLRWYAGECETHKEILARCKLQ